MDSKLSQASGLATLILEDQQKRTRRSEMKSALMENARPPAPGTQSQRPDASSERQLSLDQFSRAVGDHALRQAEIDKKMATRIVELRDDLSAAKDEIRSLRSQIEQLIQGLSQGLAIAQQQSAIATKSALQASLACLRSR
jgi:polyhydroxyalkanoate synthesis regulator phasin